ncbi:Uncharacterised protein [Shewanella putrefaciens]|nr:Uncharacterised protein [Shewanella putrefaciens]
MSKIEIKVTEYNYAEALEPLYFEYSSASNYVTCSNPECNSPKLFFDPNNVTIMCTGKENIGRNCMRLFKVELVNV